jgi:hypothetical protein
VLVTTSVSHYRPVLSCLPSRRGEQAVAVKGKPEALRQAMDGEKDGFSRDSTALWSDFMELALLENTQKATCLIRQARDTA